MTDPWLDQFVQVILGELADGADGESIEKVLAATPGIVRDAAELHAERVFQRLVAPEGVDGLHEQIENRLSFERRLHQHWSAAFDALTSLRTVCQESGSSINDQRERALDPLTHKVVGMLHARTCRVGGEVLALLMSGYPGGAMARCRAMHEMTVIGGVLLRAWEDSGTDGFARRYMEHAEVKSLGHAESWDEHSTALNRQKAECEEIDALRQASDVWKNKYGKGFSRDYGWADGLLGPGSKPGMVELERYAGRPHMRPYVMWANHEVHGGSAGLHLNISRRAGAPLAVTGPTNEGLHVPGQLAAQALLNSHSTLIGCIEPRYEDAVTGYVALKLTDLTSALFCLGQDSVVEAERTFQSVAERP